MNKSGTGRSFENRWSSLDTQTTHWKCTILPIDKKTRSPCTVKEKPHPHHRHIFPHSLIRFVRARSSMSKKSSSDRGKRAKLTVLESGMRGLSDRFPGANPRIYIHTVVRKFRAAENDARTFFS